MKKGIYLVLIYLLIFRAHQKNSEFQLIYKKDNYQKLTPYQPVIQPGSDSGRQDLDSMYFVNTETAEAPGAGCSPAREKRKTLLASR